MDQLLSRLFNQPGSVGITVTALLLAVAELGYRLGRRSATAGDEARTEIDVVQAAVLAMLGLLLGFTFSLGLERYDNRRALVIREATAMRTTWLQASLLPQAHQQPVRGLLAEYVDVRLRGPAALRDPALAAEVRRRTVEIQSKLWEHAEASAREARDDITAIFVSTLNDLFEIDAERFQAARSRIPGGVWLILLVVGGVGCSVSGYAAGVRRVRSALVGLLLPLLLSTVILLIVDIADERRGAIGVSQQPLIDLRDSLLSSAPPGPGR
jgi:hypothetical protein